jgi:hypothetical protein
MTDSFKTRATLTVGGRQFQYHDLPALAKATGATSAACPTR